MARNIEREVNEAFDAVRADDALKNRTRDAVLEQMRAGQESGVISFSAQQDPGMSRRNFKRKLLAAAACLVFVCLVAFGGYHVYFTPVAAISVDINPSMELGVNCFDRVVGVEAFNEDGQQLVDSLELENENYEQAVERIVGSAAVQQLLSADEDLSISVASSDGTRCDNMLTTLEHCTSRYENASCHHVDEAEVEAAHHAGFSFGKYRAYLAAREADEKLTVEDAQDMTMRELHDCARGHVGTGSGASVGNGSAGQGSGAAQGGSHGEHHGHYHGEE